MIHGSHCVLCTALFVPFYITFLRKEKPKEEDAKPTPKHIWHDVSEKPEPYKEYWVAYNVFYGNPDEIHYVIRKYCAVYGWNMHRKGCRVLAWMELEEGMPLYHD